MNNITTDIFIIGGGINGTAIAADAAGRGLSVILCEKNDLAAGTSSCSSKLIHGGLRYLEQFEFSLVKKALHEREILMKRAPNIITPLEFVLPYESHLRPAWMIKIGLFLYDHLAKRQILPASTSLSLQNNSRGIALQSHLKKGFSYYDCYADDARLVILNALSAHNNHASILTRTEFISAKALDDCWKIELKNIANGNILHIFAKTLINVSGPWVQLTQNKIQNTKPLDIRLIKGSHFVIPKLYEGNFAYILQNKDQRIIFTIPFEKKYTLIGTTDVSFDENIENITISEKEENYLCNIINAYFKHAIQPSDILWSYAGVRCLQDEKEKPSQITRDYSMKLEYIKQLPLLTIISGKLTTHRLLAEEALDHLRPLFKTMKPAWTANHVLPGSDFTNYDFEKFYVSFKKDFSWLPDSLAYRYAKNYGTRAYQLLNAAKNISDLGLDFNHGLYEKEVAFLIKYEWAKTSADILWRRTKLGLVFSKNDVEKLEDWLRANLFFKENPL